MSLIFLKYVHYLVGVCYIVLGVTGLIEQLH